MLTRIRRHRVGALLTVSLAALLAEPAHSQTADAPAAVRQSAAQPATTGDGEIIVTARKREETALDVPVALVALNQQGLERYATRDLIAIST